MYCENAACTRDIVPDGTVVVYICNRDYKPMLGTNSQLRCRGDHWEGSPGVCGNVLFTCRPATLLVFLVEKFDPFLGKKCT